MKNLALLLVLAFAAGASAPAYAQNGCVNSPENPTALLAVVGSAGALLASARHRMRRK